MAKWKQDQQGWDEERLRLAPLRREQYNSISPQNYEQCQKCSWQYKLLFIVTFCRCSVIFLLSSITTVLNKGYRWDHSSPHVSIPARRHAGDLPELVFYMMTLCH